MRQRSPVKGRFASPTGSCWKVTAPWRRKYSLGSSASFGRDVVHGQHGHRREALRGGDEPLGHPVVVEPRRLDLQLGAPDVEAAEEGEVRVDNLAPHAVGVEVAEPPRRVARTGREGLLV